jgi:hypothetical protein
MSRRVGRAKGAKLRASDQVELVRVSLDEFNLATFPVSVLDKKAQRSREPLQFRDVITVAGRQIERHWKVFPHQEEGFPGPADDDVLMALFELTREQGGAKKIFFTRYQLCKKLGWPLNTFYYQRIESSFRKLAAVHVEATNAFGDQERKKFINMGFTIIQEYKLFDEAAGREKLSYVLWSDRMAASISQKLTRYLDASFYFEELETPLEKRLFRYLDSQFDQGSRQLAINIRDLCYEHLGIARRYRYTSQLMQKLDGPLQKLVAKGFLSRWRLDGEILLVACAESFAARVRLAMPMTEMLADISAVSTPGKSRAKKKASDNAARPAASSAAAAVTAPADAAISLATPLKALAAELSLRGVEVGVARDIAARAADCQPEVMAAVRYFDAECARGKRFDNPAGLLVSLIRKCLPPEQMPPPGRRRANSLSTSLTMSGGAQSSTAPARARQSLASAAAAALDEEGSARENSARAEIDYQEYIIEMGRRAFDALPASEQKRLLQAARQELLAGAHASKYQRMPAEKFAEHLRALVEKGLSRQQALPFSQWRKLRRKK